MAEPTPGLHPAQNRALRELYAVARELVAHYEQLAPQLPAGPGREVLENVAGAGRDLLDELRELTRTYGLFGQPAAQGVGARFAGVRRVFDKGLERNQALRYAVLDLQHLTTLLAYLAALGEQRSDEAMGEFCGRWERKLKRQESAARKAVVALAETPDGAIVPLDDGRVGRVAHGMANAAGTFGEWLDRQAGRRRGGG